MDDGPTYCDHCGNLTFKKFIGNCNTKPNETNAYVSYSLYQCEICEGPTLEKEYRQLPTKIITLMDPPKPAELVGTEQLWPPPLSLPPEAPEQVRNIYEEARSVMRRSPSSFVVQIGRALEAVTRNRNAEGETFNNRLNWLISEDHLPQVFGDMGHINRLFRNWGAHFDENEVEPGDVEITNEFFKAIVEYLYVAPAKVARVKNIIQQRRK